MGDTAKATEIKVEPIDVAIGEAHGLLWAFDSLYVVVNRGRSLRERALSRPRHRWRRSARARSSSCARSTAGASTGRTRSSWPPTADRSTSWPATPPTSTGTLQLAGAEGLGRGQPPAADGQRQQLHGRREGPRRHHLPRHPRTGRCGSWSRWATATRSTSPSTAMANCSRCLDSDMEWDVNTPWYRPTRVMNATSSSGFGYRNGAGKWPAFTAWTASPPVANVGPGSPTGVTFGYGARVSRRSTRRPCTSATGATASSMPCISSHKARRTPASWRSSWPARRWP